MTRLAFFALALALAAPASAMQGGSGPILLRAKGPISKLVAAGKPLPAARLALQSGDVLMLLDGRGVRTLTGPGILQNGAFTRTGPSAIGGNERIGAVRGGSDGRARVASVRNAGVQSWAVPISDIGTVCLPADRELTLWRRGGPVSAIEIQPAGSGTARSIAWPAGSERLDWPNDLPTTAGAKYRLVYQSGAGTREIEFRELSAEDPACQSQIDFNIKLVDAAENQMVDEYLN